MALQNTYTPNAPQAKTGQGSALGNREDLSDILTTIDPKSTPVTSLCGQSKAKSTFHEWPVDNLDAPAADGVLESADVDSFADKSENLARLGNYVQIFRRTFGITNLQAAVDGVGPKTVAESEAKAMLELKRDMEFAICSANDRQAGTGAVPYKMRGLGDWIDSAGPSDVPAEYRTPSASIITSTITEGGLNDVLGSIFTKSGEMANLTMVCNVALRKLVANFLRASSGSVWQAFSVTQPTESKKITLSVSLVETDFGVIKVVNGNPACMPTATTNVGYILDPKYLSYASLIPMGSTRLENKGAGDRGFVDATGTLVVRNPLAFGKVAYS